MMIDAADTIKKLRTELGMTQEQLGHKLGVSFLTVSRWERGKSRPSSLALREIKRLGRRTEALTK